MFSNYRDVILSPQKSVILWKENCSLGMPPIVLVGMLAQNLFECKVFWDKSEGWRSVEHRIFFAEKVKVFPLFFQKPVIVCICKERKKNFYL